MFYVKKKNKNTKKVFVPRVIEEQLYSVRKIHSFSSTSFLQQLPVARSRWVGLVRPRSIRQALAYFTCRSLPLKMILPFPVAHR